MPLLHAIHGEEIKVTEVTHDEIIELRQKYRNDFTEALLKNGRDPRDQELMMNDWWPGTTQELPQA